MVKIRPIPLYDKKINLLLFFTPKAACSFGVKWFFYQIGEYDNCNNYHGWPHNYRLHIYNKKINSNLDDDIFKSKTIFLVRDPLKRAVSSYLHSIKNNLEFSKISNFLQKPLDDSNTFSFSEFITFLKSIDINKCNPHWKIQTNVYSSNDKFENKEIVKVENIVEELKIIEEKYDLKKSPMDEISNSLKFHKINIKNNISEFCFEKKFSKEDLNNGVPNYKYFYNDKLIDDVYNIYKSDFENYNYKLEIK